MKQATSSATTFYLWSSVLGQPVLELSGGGGITRAYVFSSSGQRVAVYTSSSFYWIHGDHLGSSHNLTDTSGNVAYSAEYDPHGNVRLETGTTTLTTRKFTGYERDGANLDFANARTYAYKRGRFLQVDPLGLGASDVTSPQSLNLYSYVGNDPINAVDPSGLRYVLQQTCIRILDGEWDCSYEWVDVPEPRDPRPQEPKPRPGGGGGGGGGGGQGEGQKQQLKQDKNFWDCLEKYRFSSIFNGSIINSPTLQRVAEFLEIGPPISLAGDAAAAAYKATRTGIGGSTQPYASGLNYVFKKAAQAIGSQGLHQALRQVGSRVTPVLAVTGTFTASYNLIIAAQCGLGVLR